MEKYTVDTGTRQYRVHSFAELGSTNDEASSREYSDGDVVVAVGQTKGRGQRGNYWHSTPGLNLTFSVVVEPTFLPAAEQFLLSEVVSLAVTDTLRHYGIEALIKWPNDIYVGDSKIAGILIENDIYGPNISRSIIGIGLNVNEREFPEHLPNPVSMVSVNNTQTEKDTHIHSNLYINNEIDIQGVLTQFLECFEDRYQGLAEGNISQITENYHTLIYRKNIPGRFRLPDGTEFKGIITKINKSGMILIVKEGGEVVEFLFKGVELIL